MLFLLCFLAFIVRIIAVFPSRGVLYGGPLLIFIHDDDILFRVLNSIGLWIHIGGSATSATYLLHAQWRRVVVPTITGLLVV